MRKHQKNVHDLSKPVDKKPGVESRATAAADSDEEDLWNVDPAVHLDSPPTNSPSRDESTATSPQNPQTPPTTTSTDIPPTTTLLSPDDKILEGRVNRKKTTPSLV